MDTKKFITNEKEIIGKTIESCHEYGELCIKFTDSTFFVVKPLPEDACLTFSEEKDIDLYDKVMLNIITEEEYHKIKKENLEKEIKLKEDKEKKELRRLKAKYE